ncbi:SPOR domain-containing protein [[Pseudomonas] boreopolis]|uniref:SPOR domain-containing protein n=1 Tax=Xanthomonas boreopolis TaxID=86183 RepID=UPI003DA17155
MLVRALIVVLAILNLGVALWWLSRPDAAPAVPPVAGHPAGVATLELAGPADASATPAVEAPAATAQAEPAPSPAPPPAANAAPPAEPEARCLSLGPYATQAEAQAALGRAGALLEKGRLREEHADASGGYRVLMPSVGDRAMAQAIAKRIAEAGLGDYYVISKGEDNTVALGQYRSREGAERRLAELKAKGFSAELVVNGQSRWWIDARTRAPGKSLPAALGALRQRSLDCAAMR